MFDFSPAVLAEARERFRASNGRPYAHLVLDGLLAPGIARECQREFLALDTSSFVCYGEPMSEYLKFAQNDVARMPPALRAVFDHLQSDSVVAALGEICGHPNLRRDETYWGAGLHLTRPGGYLAIHQDFSVLPPTYCRDLQYRRVLNVIGYFTDDWDESDGGEFELWSGDGSRCEGRVAPVFNRWLLFDTRGSNHGHPWPYRGRRPRCSIASYYYVEERVPEEQWHSTKYLKLPWRDDEPGDEEKRRQRADAKLRYAKFLTNCEVR
jgi:hypothetical protein